jgi:hypothetical protein
MAIREYECVQHGRFERLELKEDNGTPMCPRCGFIGRRVMSCPAPVRVVYKERLRYGNGDKGRMLTSAETGGLDIFIPSGGAMDKAEIDDVACAAIEKEHARVKSLKRQPRSANQEAITNLTHLAHQTKKGQRIKVLREAIKETGLAPQGA